MRQPTSTSDIDIALERFALRDYLVRNGFELQGRAKVEAVGDCLWCGGEDKLSINVQTKAHRCFVCHRRFKLLDVVAKIEGSYQQAISVVFSETGVYHALDFIPELQLRGHTDYLRDAHWEPMPMSPPVTFAALVQHHPYTLRRGFSIEALRLLGVGVCSWGRYQDRLVFPVRRPDGAWIYFQSRATWEKAEQLPDLDGKTRYRKNVNPEHLGPQYADASDVLMGLDVVIRNRLRRVAMGEGPTDLLNLVQGGAVATLGKNVSDRQVQLLIRAGVSEVDYAHDPDAYDAPTTPDGRPTGRRAPADINCERLAAAGITVRQVRYDRKQDPGNTSPEENWRLRMTARPYGDGSRLLFV